eukprot:5764131-Alexandrium_andersonii.AAC.1
MFSFGTCEAAAELSWGPPGSSPVGCRGALLGGCRVLPRAAGGCRGLPGLPGASGGSRRLLETA